MDNPKIGMRVRGTERFPHQGRGLTGVIVKTAGAAAAAVGHDWIGVQFDEGQDTEIKHVVEWHRSYFDAVDPDQSASGQDA